MIASTSSSVRERKKVKMSKIHFTFIFPEILKRRKRKTACGLFMGLFPQPQASHGYCIVYIFHHLDVHEYAIHVFYLLFLWDHFSFLPNLLLKTWHKNMGKQILGINLKNEYLFSVLNWASDS